ncbi:hypothetical protein IR083_03880 [Dysgonomonas sp. GY75]|uniref:hypothetical protein n=1 Tax=Dysgonomonas sp. GY75 TaxID=2780419 RepID=UPI0018841D78|nr:hypothetical protein [Dysgonomonas sp. GY75]MBF0647952.1 hypothetical protein [Dysgonomonas sp. GY75]
MKNVLIIEDEQSNFQSIKEGFEKYPQFFSVFPQEDNAFQKEYKNIGYLIDRIVRNKTENSFQEIIEYYPDIDLFVIDPTLDHTYEDHTGIEFLNFVFSVNYRLGNFKYIIVSQHAPVNLIQMDFPFDTNTDYVSKSILGMHYPAEIVSKSGKLLDLDISQARMNGPKNKFYNEVWWLKLTDKIERHIIDRFVLFVLYVTMIISGLYAIVCIIKETINVCFLEKHTEVVYLEYIEKIFLFLLPVFIVFSFFSYYKSTVQIRLTGGNTKDIDHKGSMLALNNSKIILVTSFISFTIIKIIEKIFISGSYSLLSLLAYFTFLVVLMAYAIILHRSNHE